MTVYVFASISILFVMCIIFLMRIEALYPGKAEVIYAPKHYFYTNSERKFLASLIRALGDQYLIMGKIQVSDLINLQKDLPFKKKVQAYNQLRRQQVDFVLCDRRTTRILAAIQLINPSTTLQNDFVGFGFLDKIFKIAELPLLRFYKKNYYDISELRYSVQSALEQVPDQNSRVKKFANLQQSF